MAPVEVKPALYSSDVLALLATPAAIIASYIVTTIAILLIVTWVAYIRIGTGPDRRMRDRIKRRLERKKLWMARKATQALDPFTVCLVLGLGVTTGCLCVGAWNGIIWNSAPIVDASYNSLTRNEMALKIVDSLMKNSESGTQIPNEQLRFALVQIGKHVMYSSNTAREVIVSALYTLSVQQQALLDHSFAPVVARFSKYDELLKPRVQVPIDWAALDAQDLGANRPCNIGPDLSYLEALLEQDSVSNLRYGVLFLLALSSLGVYSIILAGWSSNSKYAFIGALRSAAQMISYEVAISLIILPIVVLAGSLNLTMITYVQTITTWFLWPLLPISLVFLIAMLAETNRTPFDLPEAEAELVAGYNVDYSSLPFAMFFLGEYCNMILISVLFCLLFLGGGLNTLGLHSAALLAVKAAVIWIFFVIVRATLPRYRYDQLMDIGWKVFLPISGGFLVFVFGILVYFDGLPVTSELPRMIHALFTDAAAFLFVIQPQTVSVGAWP